MIPVHVLREHCMDFALDSPENRASGESTLRAAGCDTFRFSTQYALDRDGEVLRIHGYVTEPA